MSQQINLYNAAFIPPRQWLTATSLAIGCAVLLAGVVAGSYEAQRRKAATVAQLSTANSELQALKVRVAVLRADAEARAADPELARQGAELKERIARREQLIGLSVSALGEPGQGYAEYLRGLSRQAGAGIWLTRLTVGERGQSLSLAGGSVRKETVADYVRRLNAEPAFRGKNFGGLKIDAPAPVEAAGAANAAAKGSKDAATDDTAPRVFSFELLAAGAATEAKK